MREISFTNEKNIFGCKFKHAIDYMRANEIVGIFSSFDWPTGPPHNVGGPSGSFCLQMILFGAI